MCAEAASASAGEHRLERLDLEHVKPDPKNPRLRFPQEELDKLCESIDEAGVLVPIVVYQDDDSYHLIDGERRYLCSKRLGLKTVPATIVAHPNEVTRLTHMFNIHLVREPWQDIPTAKALEQYIAATGITEDEALSAKLGLSLERIKRLRLALELPKAYQDYIFDGKIPLNFFWELDKYLIQPLARHRPKLSAELPKMQILDSFVTKRLEGVVTDVVALRKISPIIQAARQEEDATGATETAFDQVLRDLITRPDATIEDAYNDTVASRIEFDKLTRQVDNTVKAYQRAYERAPSDRREAVCAAIEDLASRLMQIVGH